MPRDRFSEQISKSNPALSRSRPLLLFLSIKSLSLSLALLLSSRFTSVRAKRNICEQVLHENKDFSFSSMRTKTKNMEKSGLGLAELSENVPSLLPALLTPARNLDSPWASKAPVSRSSRRALPLKSLRRPRLSFGGTLN